MKAIILTSVLGILAMISEIIGIRKWITTIVLVALAGIIGINILDFNKPEIYYGMLTVDHYSVIFSTILLGITFVWFLLSQTYFSEENGANPSDQSALILFATVGGLLLVSFNNLSLLFLGIEIMSIPMYILAGSNKKSLASNEASIKYFIMGAFATGLLLFGIALIYGATGSFDIVTIRQGMMANLTDPSTLGLSLAGILFILIAFAFKVSAAPFQFWTPDVYEGSPSMVTAYMSTFIKTAAFVAFFRLFNICFTPLIDAWYIHILFMICLTILIGNIIAVNQSSFKRTLAYSGIAQAGYILFTILLQNQEALTALIIYSIAYSIATMIGFTVIFHIEKSRGSLSFDSFKGLGKTNPGLAVVLSFAMLSLAGIPPTAGFFAKFYLFNAVLSFNTSLLPIVLLAIIGSLISLYYYFKVIKTMFGDEADTQQAPIQITTNAKLVLYLVTSLLLILGLAPQLLLSLGKMI
jgi:NADH-quinone oxidoreductase subunit N